MSLQRKTIFCHCHKSKWLSGITFVKLINLFKEVHPRLSQVKQVVVWVFTQKNKRSHNECKYVESTLKKTQKKQQFH